MAKSVRFWNKIAKNYDNSVKGKYEQAYRETIELTQKYLNPDKTVLDFACGTGITTILQAGSVKHITAIDISDKMIKLARKKAEIENLTNIDFSTADLFDTRFDNTKVDIIMAFNILYFIDDVESLIGRFQDMLNPKGLFISVTDCLGEKVTSRTRFLTHLSRLGIIPSMKLFTMSELTDCIGRNGFKIIESKNLFPEPPNLFICAKRE